jgi:hypothetical protein
MKKYGDRIDPRSVELELLLASAQRASICVSAEGVPCASIPGKTSDQHDVTRLYSREFASYLRDEYQTGRYPKEGLLRVVCELLEQMRTRCLRSTPTDGRLTRTAVLFFVRPHSWTRFELWQAKIARCELMAG